MSGQVGACTCKWRDQVHLIGHERGCPQRPSEIVLPREDHCFWHGVEPIPDGAYLVCGECFHCWPTEADFVRDIEAHGVEANETNRLFCPLCAHDF